MKYGFIGCGNMGGPLAIALSKATKDILITDRSGKAKTLADSLGCGYGSIQAVAEECDRIFLGVKPQMMAGVLESIRPVLQRRKPLLITMAASLTTQRIQEMSGTSLPVIRIMPNTPAAVGKGVTLYCSNALVDADMMTSFLEDMNHAGLLQPLDEHLFDAASAVSGSGPAFLYMFLEAMADGAVACGVPRSKAMELAAATMVGAGEMYLNSREHPGMLKDAVCSPAGSTIAGIRVLEKGGFRSAVTEAVIATYQRNLEIDK